MRKKRRRGSRMLSSNTAKFYDNLCFMKIKTETSTVALDGREACEWVKVKLLLAVLERFAQKILEDDAAIARLVRMFPAGGARAIPVLE